jgi:DNA-directed RNA polymerase subunit RPC12/RpoP
MAGKSRDEGSKQAPQDTRETHAPARGAPGAQSTGGQRAGHDHSGDREDADGKSRRDPTREASGEALRRQMASPTIDSVTTMVCVTCGAEQFFDGRVPSGLKCQRCGSMVFRTFETPTRRDEATIAHLEEEARSVQYGDVSPSTSPDELRDLDMK